MPYKQTPKDAATERLIFSLESLTRCLATLQSRYDAMTTATDDDTFSYLCRLHGELRQLTRLLGIDRVHVNPKTDNYEWVHKVVTPDGEWKRTDLFSEAVTLNGYRAAVSTLDVPPYDVAWKISKDDRDILAGTVASKNNPGSYADAKREALARLRELADEKA